MEIRGVDLSFVEKGSVRRWMREAAEVVFIPTLDKEIARMNRSKVHGFVKRSREQLRGSYKVCRYEENGVVVGSNVAHAGVHEGILNDMRVGHAGSTIMVTSSGKKMTVPLSGVSMSNEELVSLRAAKETFIRKDVIFLREPTTPIFVLKRNIRMRVSGYVTKTIENASPKIIAFLERKLVGK